MPANFIDAPPLNKRRKGKYDWETVVADLKANPGQWAVIEGHDDVIHNKGAAQATARAIRAGTIRGAKPTDEFEATTRETVVYARYVGKRGTA